MSDTSQMELGAATPAGNLPVDAVYEARKKLREAIEHYGEACKETVNAPPRLILDYEAAEALAYLAVRALITRYAEAIVRGEMSAGRMDAEAATAAMDADTAEDERA